MQILITVWPILSLLGWIKTAYPNTFFSKCLSRQIQPRNFGNSYCINTILTNEIITKWYIYGRYCWVQSYLWVITRNLTINLNLIFLEHYETNTNGNFMFFFRLDLMVTKVTILLVVSTANPETKCWDTVISFVGKVFSLVSWSTNIHPFICCQVW